MGYAKLKKVAAALRPFVERMCRELEVKRTVGRKGFGLFPKLTVLILRQILGIETDVAMERTLRESSALRAICRLGRAMDNTTISKARKWIGVARLCKIWFALLAECKRVGLIKGRLISVDSTEFEKYYRNDPDAQWGYCASKMKFFDGFKAHIVTDDLSELPIGVVITAGNVHDAPLFGELILELGKVFTYEVQKILADCGYDAAWIRRKIRDRGIADVIARNGRGHFESEDPDDPEYSFRSASERVNSRAKLLHGLENFRLKGLGGAAFHVLTVLCSMIWSSLASFLADCKDFRSVETLRW